MAQKYTIESFVGKEGFRQIENDWNVVFKSLSKEKFFYRYEWYKCYMEALKPKEEKIYFFVIYKKEIPLAIFPLRKGIKNLYGIKLKVWESLFHYHFVFSNFIYEANNNKDIWIFFIKYLSEKNNFKYDAIIIHSVLEDSTLLYSLKFSEYLLKVAKHLGTCSFLYTNDFKKEAKRKKSKSLNKKYKRLQKLGKVEFTKAVEENDLLKDFDIFIDVESSGWKGKEGTAIKCNEELVKFYRCLITEFMNYDGCHIYLLKVNDECIAGNFCIVDDDTIYSLKIGYREDYARYSPGIICSDNLFKMITEFKNIKFINLITYQERHDIWNPYLYNLYEISIFNISIPGIYVFVIEKGKQWLKQLFPGLKKK